MTPAPQSLLQTLAFSGCLGMGILIFMLRPASWEGALNDWPRLYGEPERVVTMTPEEAQRVLEAYALLDSTEVSPPSSDSDLVQSKVEKQKEAVTPAQAPPTDAPQAARDEAAGYDRQAVDQFLHETLQLQGSKVAFTTLGSFFAALNSENRKPPIHVLHFGDSQIEGDRITGYLRNAWQGIWGGGGPGFISPASPIPSLAMRQSWSGEWERYARFGKKDSTLDHNRYGLMAAFIQPAVAKTDSVATGSSLHFEPHPKGYRRNQQFNQLHVLLGKTDSSTVLNYALNGEDEIALPLPADSISQSIAIPLLGLDSIPFQSLDLRFTGGQPEVNGVGMWADSGIVVHNLAMRGSSGTLFRQLHREQFVEQLHALNTELVILQYGGNTVPYITEVEAAKRYGGWFASQIKLFQQSLPGVPILVIGPSDMARKSGTLMETYPQLTWVRDALKEAAWDTNALYWDVFEVMGGPGSMAAWVQSEPALASADHIHFTPRGAKQIAELLRQSIQAEWTLWQNTQAEQTLVDAP